MTLGGVYNLKIYNLLWLTSFPVHTYSYAIRLLRIYTQGKSTGQALRFAGFPGSIASQTWVILVLINLNFDDHRRQCFYCGPKLSGYYVYSKSNSFAFYSSTALKKSSHFHRVSSHVTSLWLPLHWEAFSSSLSPPPRWPCWTPPRTTSWAGARE